MEQQSDRKMKCRSRKRGEKNKGKKEKGSFGPHARQLCKLKVSAASHVPLKKGDIYRRLALQLMDPCSVTPSNIIIIITLLCKKWKMSATREVFRDIVCACGVFHCQLVSSHIHKKVSAGENRSFLWEESKDRTREKEQKNGTSALYWGL